MPPAPVMFCGTTSGLPGMCLPMWRATSRACRSYSRSEEHTSELQSLRPLVCRPLLEKKKWNSEGVKRRTTFIDTADQPGTELLLLAPSGDVQHPANIPSGACRRNKGKSEQLLDDTND